MGQQMTPSTNGVREEALWLPSYRTPQQLCAFPRTHRVLNLSQQQILNFAMSDKYANLDRSDSDITIDNDFGRKHDSEIDVIPKDEIVGMDSVSDLFESCLRRYGILLLALQTEALRSEHLIINLVPDIKDEFSRLRIWGEQTYAVLPQNARHSLDEQLREDENTKKVVTSCLRRLNNHIEKGWSRHNVGPEICD